MSRRHLFVGFWVCVVAVQVAFLWTQLPIDSAKSDELTHNLTPPSVPQTQARNLSDDFNFWLGEWNTEASTAPDWQTRQGKDVVQSHLEGKLLEEVFTKGASKENFQRGYLFYLQREQKWQHMIYDVNWGEYRFLGGPTANADGEPMIVLESPDDDTRPGKRRETFSNITEDSFDYLWEESRDGGKTWQAMWKVKYKRAKDAEK